jgi:esterase/lipase
MSNNLKIISEISFRNFQKTVTENSPKQKLNKSYRMINKSLDDINKILEHSTRLKEECGNSMIDEDRRKSLYDKIVSIYKKVKTL